MSRPNIFRALLISIFMFSACGGSEQPAPSGRINDNVAGATGVTGPTGAAGTTSAAGTTAGATGPTGTAGTGTAGTSTMPTATAGASGTPTGAAGADAAGAGASGMTAGGGAPGMGGTATGGADTAAGGSATMGGADTAAGGMAGMDTAAGGSGPDGTNGGMTTEEVEPLDCGPDGWAVENHGPPENRVNYVILADGYDATTINTTLEEDINRAFARRFDDESGEPYGRYRNFVNICVMKVVSQSNGIGNGPTAFDGGNGGDRLAAVNSQKVNSYLDQNLPERLEADWTAVVLNQSKWENTGSILMLWSGGNQDGPGAALHEGGHGFHQLADEYGTCTGAGCGEDTNGSGSTGQEYQEVNSTGNPMTTGNKWDLWMGTTQVAIKDPNGTATGKQSTWSGSRYESPSSGQYRPSDNSMMNSLFGTNPNTSFNSVSREQMVFSIWRNVKPIDSTVPEAGAVSGAGTLQVNVIDPAVINVDWSVDGAMSAENGGTTFDTSVLGSGSHTVSARAYDNATEDLVKLRTGQCPSAVRGNYCHATAWPNHEETVEWTVTIP